MLTARLITGALLHVGGDTPSPIRNATEDAQPERRNKRQGRLQINTECLWFFDSLLSNAVCTTQRWSTRTCERVTCLFTFVFHRNVCAFACLCVKNLLVQCARGLKALALSHVNVCARAAQKFMPSSPVMNLFIAQLCTLTFVCCYWNVVYVTNATLNNMSFNAIQIPQIIS